MAIKLITKTFGLTLFNGKCIKLLLFTVKLQKIYYAIILYVLTSNNKLFNAQKMIALSRKILLYLLIFLVSSIFAQDPGSSGKSVSLQWQINKGQISFPGAVYPTEFSGLPVYSYAWNNGRNGSVDAALANAVYKPLQGFNLSPAQIRQIGNQPVI